MKNIIKKSIASLALTTMLTSPALAEDLFITADAMIDTVAGRLIKNPAILISNNKIVKVGTKGSLKAPAGAKTVNLEGQTIMPGWMDMHVHLSSALGNTSFFEGMFQSVPRQTVNAVVNAKITLMAGFTSVRNVGAGDYTVIGVRNSIKAGEIDGPRIWAAGHALGVTGGHCDNNVYPPEMKIKNKGIANGPWEIKAKIRENIKYGADALKFCATGGVFSRGTKVGAIQYTFEEMKAIADEGHHRGLVVAAHAHGTEGIKTAIRAGVDSIEHASILDDEAIALAKKHGTYFSMDIYNTEYTQAMGMKLGIPEENMAKDRAIAQVQRDGFRAAVKAGVNMVFGSDAAIYPHGDNAKQFSRMVQFGMTEMQALQAATINAATLMKASKLGAIKVGNFADIVAVKGNPLDDITVTESVSFVMKDGKVYKK